MIIYARWKFYWNHGHFVVHTPKRSFFLLSSRDVPLFTERYGTDRITRLPFGWRWRVKDRRVDWKEQEKAMSLPRHSNS